MTAAVMTAPNAIQRARPVRVACIRASSGTKSSIQRIAERNASFQESVTLNLMEAEATTAAGHRRRPQGPMNGRPAEGARNDPRILDSARAGFLADPRGAIH